MKDLASEEEPRAALDEPDSPVLQECKDDDGSGVGAVFTEEEEEEQEEEEERFRKMTLMVIMSLVVRKLRKEQ